MPKRQRGLVAELLRERDGGRLLHSLEILALVRADFSQQNQKKKADAARPKTTPVPGTRQRKARSTFASAFGDQTLSQRASCASIAFRRQVISRHRDTCPLPRDRVESPAPTAYDNQVAMGKQVPSGNPTAPRFVAEHAPRQDASCTYREQQYHAECRHRRSDIKAMGEQALAHLPSVPSYSFAGGKPRKLRVRGLLTAAPPAVRVRYAAEPLDGKAAQLRVTRPPRWREEEGGGAGDGDALAMTTRGDV